LLKQLQLFGEFGRILPIGQISKLPDKQLGDAQLLLQFQVMLKHCLGVAANRLVEMGAIDQTLANDLIQAKWNAGDLRNIVVKRLYYYFTGQFGKAANY
jgi:hypothetical protein